MKRFLLLFFMLTAFKTYSQNPAGFKPVSRYYINGKLIYKLTDYGSHGSKYLEIYNSKNFKGIQFANCPLCGGYENKNGVTVWGFEENIPEKLYTSKNRKIDFYEKSIDKNTSIIVLKDPMQKEDDEDSLEINICKVVQSDR
jgi:hypothetical protein